MKEIFDINKLGTLKENSENGEHYFVTNIKLDAIPEALELMLFGKNSPTELQLNLLSQIDRNILILKKKAFSFLEKIPAFELTESDLSLSTIVIYSNQENLDTDYGLEFSVKSSFEYYLIEFRNALPFHYSVRA